MGSYDRKDHYYRKAKEKGLPSRASFKMEEILKKFSLADPGDLVLDLGAAPGGWAVILAKAVAPGGRVLALDLQPLKKIPAPNIRFFQGDIQGPEAAQWIRENLGGKQAACVCSDLSPKLSGIPFRDAYLSYELGLKALEIAKNFLKRGGSLVTKIFPGQEFQGYLKTLRSHFEKVKVFEPQSSRKTSREVYVLGLGFKPSL